MFGLWKDSFSGWFKTFTFFFLVYQTAILTVHLRKAIAFTCNGLTNTPRGCDGEMYTLGTFSVTWVHLRRLTDGDLYHKVLTYSDEVPCYWDILADLIFPSLCNRSIFSDILKLWFSVVKNDTDTVQLYWGIICIQENLLILCIQFGESLPHQDTVNLHYPKMLTPVSSQSLPLNCSPRQPLVCSSHYSFILSRVENGKYKGKSDPINLGKYQHPNLKKICIYTGFYIIIWIIYFSK